MQYWLYMFISVFCKFAVPVFFMISGAVMLNKETTSYRELYKHKVLRVCVLLVFWSAMHCLFKYFINNSVTDLSITAFLKRLAISDWDGSLWYLYSYIAFLLSLPILQRIAKALSNKEYFYLIILAFVFSSLLPFVQYLLWRGQYGFNGNFNLGWLCATIFIYPMIGYFLQHRTKGKWNGKYLVILWGVNVATICISCLLTHYQAKISGVLSEAESQLFHNMFVMVNAISIFATCQYVFAHIKLHENLRKAITSMGGTTFGIYLLHIFIHKICSKFNLVNVIYNTIGFNRMLSCLIYCTLIFLSGYLITLTLKRIPGLKRII